MLAPLLKHITSINIYIYVFGHIMTAKIGMMHSNIEVMGMIKFSV